MTREEQWCKRAAELHALFSLLYVLHLYSTTRMWLRHCTRAWIAFDWNISGKSSDNVFSSWRSVNTNTSLADISHENDDAVFKTYLFRWWNAIPIMLIGSQVKTKMLHFEKCLSLHKFELPVCTSLGMKRASSYIERFIWLTSNGMTEFHHTFHFESDQHR